MPELRWTLLIIGGLFVLGLALWEIRRQRQAPRQSGLNSGAPSGDRTMPSIEAGGGASAGRENVGFADASRVRNEPVITLPELQPVDPRGEPRLTARREPSHDPPVVEVDDASFARLQEGATGSTDVEAAHGEDTIAMTSDDDDAGDIDASLREAVARRAGVGPDTVGDRAGSELAGSGRAGGQRPPIRADVGTDAAGDRVASKLAGSGLASRQHTARRAGDWSDSANGGASEPDGAAFEGAAGGSGDPHNAAASQPTPPFAVSASAENASAEAATGSADGAPPSDSLGFATDSEDQHQPESRPLQSPPKRETAPMGATAAGGPIVDWPDEGSRKIVALRLVSQPAARFHGRAVRQALAAEGFVLGKFDIFHKPGPDDRAMLSAASLTKPGTFAMNTIDAQRFGGISLFAVLPGPLPPQETFDELLHTARALNDRLQGALQDERGEPLTPMRSASIRQSLCEGNASTGPGISAQPQSETRQ